MDTPIQPQAQNPKASTHILIVEDEFALADALTDALREEGYHVTATSNGEDGLKAGLEQHPTLILLDILMPKMDGMAMLKELRQKQTDPKSLVIFFTNVSRSDKIADALTIGADGYIVKADTSLEEIVQKVEQVLIEKKPQ